MGDSEQQLSLARQHIAQQIGSITRASQLYTTAAWGNNNQPDFLNQVIIVETNLAAQPLLQLILTIEENMGRVRTTKYAPRVIDIDILFYNEEIITSNNLVVPHPEIENRRFVLIPLNELDPKFTHPISKKNMKTLLLECTDPLEVKKF